MTTQESKAALGSSAGKGRPDKIKLEVVSHPPANLKFVDTIGQRYKTSIYVRKLMEALNQSGYVVIMADDGYMRHQIRKAAGKLKLRLTYALDGDKLYIKPAQIEGEMKRLVVLLREPRTLAELEAKKLELHLDKTLSSMAADGTAHLHKGKWVLTGKGMDLL